MLPVTEFIKFIKFSDLDSQTKCELFKFGCKVLDKLSREEIREIFKDAMRLVSEQILEETFEVGLFAGFMGGVVVGSLFVGLCSCVYSRVFSIEKRVLGS